MELDGLIMRSSCACSVVIVQVGIYIYMELDGLIMFNHFSYQTVASRVRDLRTLAVKPLGFPIQEL